MSEMNRKRPFSISALPEDDNTESVEPKQKPPSSDYSNKNGSQCILPKVIAYVSSSFPFNLFGTKTGPTTSSSSSGKPKNGSSGLIKPLDLDSVGGLPDQVKYVRENIIQAMRQKDVLKKCWGYEPEKGIIFHGPPGTGKTLLAKALVGELRKEDVKISYYMIKGSECYNCFLGGTERRIREIFAKAVKNKPSIIFWDELDGVAPSRGKSNYHVYTSTVTTLLTEMDAIKRGEVLVIGATNRLLSLDAALIRPGRFGKHLEFTAPNEEGRLNILKIHLAKWKRKPAEEDLTHISRETRDYTGADLEQLCRHSFDYAKERVATKNNRPLSEDDISSMEVLIEDWTKAISASKKDTTSKCSKEVLASMYT